MMLEDELAKVAVIGEQDTVLSNGDRENLIVRQAGRMVLPDPRCIVSDADEERAESRLGTLVEQEFHR